MCSVMLHTVVYYGILVMRVAVFREVGDLGLWRVLGFCDFTVWGIGLSGGLGFSGFGSRYADWRFELESFGLGFESVGSWVRVRVARPRNDTAIRVVYRNLWYVVVYKRTSYHIPLHTEP